MPSTETADSRRSLPRWRAQHGIVLALMASLLVTSGLGGPGTLEAVKRFPLGVLALMLLMAVLCWNLNAARLRLMLAGRARPAWAARSTGHRTNIQVRPMCHAQISTYRLVRRPPPRKAKSLPISRNDATTSATQRLHAVFPQ